MFEPTITALKTNVNFVGKDEKKTNDEHRSNTGLNVKQGMFCAGILTATYLLFKYTGSVKYEEIISNEYVEKGTKINGVKYGQCRVYAGENVHSEFDYVDGKVHGKYKTYYPTQYEWDSYGRLRTCTRKMEIRTYDNGKESGPYTKYYKNGCAVKETGNVVTQVQSNGISSSVLHGPQKKYYKSGNLKSITIYNFGQSAGPCVIYKNDGTNTIAT